MIGVSKTLLNDTFHLFSAAVDEACDKVEAALVYLENICEEQDLLYNKQAHHKQLAAYKLKKAHELEKIKSKKLTSKYRS